MPWYTPQHVASTGMVMAGLAPAVGLATYMTSTSVDGDVLFGLTLVLLDVVHLLLDEQTATYDDDADDEGDSKNAEDLIASLVVVLVLTHDSLLTV